MKGRSRGRGAAVQPGHDGGAGVYRGRRAAGEAGLHAERESQTDPMIPGTCWSVADRVAARGQMSGACRAALAAGCRSHVARKRARRRHAADGKTRPAVLSTRRCTGHLRRRLCGSGPRCPAGGAVYSWLTPSELITARPGRHDARPADHGGSVRGVRRRLSRPRVAQPLGRRRRGIAADHLGDLLAVLRVRLRGCPAVVEHGCHLVEHLTRDLGVRLRPVPGYRLRGLHELVERRSTALSGMARTSQGVRAGGSEYHPGPTTGDPCSLVAGTRCGRIRRI